MNGHFIHKMKQDAQSDFLKKILYDILIFLGAMRELIMVFIFLTFATNEKIFLTPGTEKFHYVTL